MRVALTSPTFHALDPQATWTQQWELLRCCLLRTLMTYRGVPGAPGTQLVPDLAHGASVGIGGRLDLDLSSEEGSTADRRSRTWR